VNLQALLDRTPRQWLGSASARLRRAPGLDGFDDRHPCVFVLSTGRAGTQTLAALFRSDPQVASHHEPLPLLYGLSTFAYRHRHDASALEPLVELFHATRDDLLDAARATGRGYFETSPQGTFLVRAIARAIEGSRFIHLTRDPLAVIRSGMRRGWYAGHPYDSHRIVPDAVSEDSPWWADASPLAKNAWLWNETNRFILDAADELGATRYLRVRAEELFAGDQRVVDEIATYIGTRPPSAARVARTLRKQLNAQRGGDFPEPSQWAEASRAEVHAIVEKTATELGYEGAPKAP
jgi:hypothetical protein